MLRHLIKIDHIQNTEAAPIGSRGERTTINLKFPRHSRKKRYSNVPACRLSDEHLIVNPPPPGVSNATAGHWAWIVRVEGSKPPAPSCLRRSRVVCRPFWRLPWRHQGGIYSSVRARRQRARSISVSHMVAPHTGTALAQACHTADFPREPNWLINLGRATLGCSSLVGQLGAF